jgi:hypothetical protein
MLLAILQVRPLNACELQNLMENVARLRQLDVCWVGCLGLCGSSTCNHWARTKVRTRIKQQLRALGKDKDKDKDKAAPASVGQGQN